MIDLLELKRAMQEMKPHQPIFKLIKAEIAALGHWKNKARGTGFSKGYDSRRNVTKL